VVWVAEEAALYGLARHLEHALELRSEAELDSRRARDELAFSRLGWHSTALPEPDGEPDPRIRTVARFRRDQVRHAELTSRDLVTDALAFRTVQSVPAEVEGIFATARLLYVRSWHQWEFFTLARREAAYAFEMGLRFLDASPPRQGPMPSLSRVIDDIDPGLITDFERRRSHRLREERNALTHPRHGQAVDWISWARAGIAEAIELTNYLWARRAGELSVDDFRELVPPEARA
jgi:hypothetical protein